MSNITLKEDELEAILAEVERDLAAVLKSESERLSKAVGDDDDEQSAPEGSAPPAEGSAPPMGAAPEEGSADEASAPALGGPPPDADAAAPQGDDQDPADDQGGDMESLKGEYAALPLEELKMHYMAAKSALLEQMQSQGGAEGSASPGEKSAPPPAPAPGPEASASPPAMKSEKAAAATLSKAEEAKNQKIAELQAQVSGLAKAVELLVSTPQRKAVTSIAYLGKTEATAEAPTLSKSEIIEKLNEKAKDPKLSKNDRSLINKFCVNKADVKSIEHLLR